MKKLLNVKTYLLTSKAMEGGGVQFGYDSNDFLVYFNATDNVNKEQLLWLLKNMPLAHTEIPQFKRKIEATGASLELVPEDLSFERFWNEYNYKLGRKPKVKRTWEGMTENARIAALLYIKKYNYWLSQHQNVERQYPSTYLSNKQWEN